MHFSLAAASINTTLKFWRLDAGTPTQQPQRSLVLAHRQRRMLTRTAEYKTTAGPFPETPEGQKEFLEEVNRIVMNVPKGRGMGIFCWEPAVRGGLCSRGMFGDDGNALPVISVFDRFTWK